VVPSLGSWLIGAGLSAIRAAAAKVESKLLYLLARLLTGDELA
jgi:CO/xanthine dehydrogenase Mo-binding subunit